MNHSAGHQHQPAPLFKTNIRRPQQQIPCQSVGHRCDSIHAARHHRHAGCGKGAAGNGSPQVADPIIREMGMLPPLRKRIVEGLVQLFLPDQTGGVGADCNSRDLAPQQFIDSLPGQDSTTGPGYSYHYWLQFDHDYETAPLHYDCQNGKEEKLD